MSGIRDSVIKGVNPVFDRFWDEFFVKLHNTKVIETSNMHLVDNWPLNSCIS